MKKFFLVLLSVSIGFAAFSQQAYKFKIDTKTQKNLEAPAIGIEPIQSPAVVKSKTEQQVTIPNGERNLDIVTIIDIGTSANAYSYGYAGGQRSIVWADPMLNVVSNFHRMGGALDPGGYSGDLGYDISFDGGATWENQVECYVAVDNAGGTYYTDAARYPAHGIYSPTGNLDDAYIAWFAPTLDGSNAVDSWGGYLYGTIKISDTSERTRTILTSRDGYYREVPQGFEITTTGIAYGLGCNEDWTSGALVYMGDLILDRGEWDEDEGKYVYEETLIEAPVANDLVVPTETKIAFGPDGMTGYIVTLTDNGEAEQQSGYFNLYPVFYKTTDGGLTWSDPTYIQLDGPDGIGGIVYGLITDEQIAELFEAPVPAREEISYTTAFDCDIAVDASNNLHIAVVIAPTGTDPHSIVSASGFINAVDLFTTDGGTSWQIETMGSLRTFRGTFGDLTEDNRIQITTNYERNKIFITWLDTDLEEEEDNNRPNIWCRGFDPFSTPYMKTAGAGGADLPTNVTNFSAGMWQSYMGTASQYAMSTTKGEWTIPMTYEEMDPTDPLAPVQYKYITNFKFTDADFSLTGINEKQELNNSIASVSQNYPNPFNGKSYVSVNLAEGSDLSLDVFTITGQRVISNDYGYQSKGNHTYTIDGNHLTPGVYFYTVTAGQSKETHKMIVE